MTDSPLLDELIAEYDAMATNQKKPRWSKWLPVLVAIRADEFKADSIEELLVAVMNTKHPRRKRKPDDAR